MRARDLLDHDAALAVELAGVDLRAADEVGQQVDRLRHHLGAAGEVEGDDVVRRVGVEHRAHLLGGLVDLAVVVVDLAALEHEVLEEVGHPVLLGALGAGAGLEGHEHGGGARALELDVVDGAGRCRGCGSGSRAYLEASGIAGLLAAAARSALGTLPHSRWPPPTIAHAAAAPAPRRSVLPPPVEGAIVDLRSVTKRYSKVDVGVEDVTFAVQPGEFVFIVGASGSGKSTLMRLLIKESEPTFGSITVAGHDLGTIPRSKIPYYRRNVGVIFQDFKLLPNRTVHDNVAYALQVTGGKRREIREKVPDILRLTGLSTKLHNFPDQLSGGEQQRVSVARAFVNHPQLLLADEPTGNLDPETSIGIMQLLYRINRTGTTVIVATHDKAMVDRMRRRVIELSGRPRDPRRGDGLRTRT